MRFRVLGAVEVDVDGQTRALGSPSQRRLLAALLARCGEVVSADTLIEAVWGDDPPPSALASLRTHVSRLRPLLGDALLTRGSGYQLVVAPEATDAGRFERLLRDAAGAPPEQAAALLDEALALWRGPAYGDEADVPCVRSEALRLDERREDAYERRARALLDAGHAGEAAAAATALVERQPLREGAWAVLIEALAKADRAAEALRAYQRAAAALAEAGLEPSPRLRSIEQGVLDGSLLASAAPATPRPVAPESPASGPTGQPAAAPAVTTSGDRQGALPVAASSFVGRDTDCRQLTELLDRARVVTLVGPGGVGKTRLALEVARVAGQRRELGARFVDLAALTDERDVPAAVIAALGLAADQGPTPDALDRAGTLDVLVVLDNAEHVVEEVAHTVDRLVRGGAALRVLATSRERLGADGEHVWSVAPLPATGADAPGCQLFIDRARAVAADLDLAPDDELVVRIVQRLDGLPLAIEMAAAQLATASLDELAVAIDRRVDALRSPRRNVAARHRSLAAVLAWSEERLSPEESATLADLSVFAGPVAAADIDGTLGRPDAADITRTLATRSLVNVDRSGSTARFSLLFTVRDFAARRLAGTPREAELAASHTAWFTSVAKEASEQLRGPGELAGYERLESVLAELRAAHRWARTARPELAVELSEHLQQYAYTRLADEPLQWAEALGVAQPELQASPIVLVAAATRLLNRGDLVRARAFGEQALAGAGRSRTALYALEVLADAAVYDGRITDCIAACEAGRDLAIELGDRHHLVVAVSGAVMARAYAGELAGSAAMEELERVTRDLPLSPTSRGWIAYTRGEVLAATDPEAAFAAYGEARRLAESVGNRLLEGVAVVSACALGARVGDLTRSLRSFAGAIRHWEQLADRTHQLTTLRNFVILLQRAGDAEAAAELLGAVDRTDVPTYGVEAERLADVRDWVASVLGEERAAMLAANGATRDVPAAAHWALGVIAALEGQGNGAAAAARSAPVGAEP